ncbi:GtrA family protein [Haloactinopolyspora alba]|uniref:GtrA family protein n=1 Tax=Haloactinopolyspora alba TaxID=648780 RepID=UPI00197AF27C|nr:GtrA family protein [Haloactinopolyspora alba]
MLETAPPPRRTSRLLGAATRVWYGLHHLIREATKFATVGGVGFVVDLVIFNALLFSGADGRGPLHDSPLWAKTVSVAAATAVTFTGNRLWTFRHRARTGLAREYSLFFLLNGIGLGIALGCLGFSRYVLGLSGPLADNIAANVVGLGLGTLFRFWSYRTWVFPSHESRRPATDSA